MRYMRELFLGLKPEAQPLLRVRPDVKIVWDLNIETGADGEIVDIGAGDIRDEPVRRNHWEAVTTRDLQHFNLLIWVFPFRMKDKYRDEIYRTAYRRVEYASRALETSSVIVVEVIDSDEETLMPESIWSVADIAAAVAEIEQEARLGSFEPFKVLMRKAWKMTWRTWRLYAAAEKLGLNVESATQEDWCRIFYQSWATCREDKEIESELSALLGRAGSPGSAIFEKYSDYLVQKMLSAIRMGYRKDAVSLAEGADYLAMFFFGPESAELHEDRPYFVERLNKINIADLYSYAREKPLLFC